MNLKSLISSKELKHSIWVVVILTLIFGFNDGRDIFVLSYWLKNLFSVFILVIITILAHIVGAKLAANKLGQEAELEIIGIKSLNFNILATRVEEKFDWNIFGFKIKYIPLTTFLGLLIMIMSYGTFYFTAISSIVIKKVHRLRDLGENREAFIYFWALAANLILIVIFNSLNIEFGVIIGSYFVLWNLLPFPGLLGSKIFFNNKLLYVFFLIFSLLFLLLFTKIELILLIVLAIVTAFLIMVFWIFKMEY